MKPISLHKIPELNEIIVSEDIKLRPLVKSDAGRILEILVKDRSIRDKVTIASRMNTLNDVAIEIEKYKKEDGLIRYTLLNKDNPIGLVSFWRDTGYFKTPPALNDYGFGYFLDLEERGKGLMIKTLTILMDIVTNVLEVNQFVAFCDDNNKASIAVLKKLGFKQTDKTYKEPKKGWTERKYTKSIII